jgi:RNase P protein component
MHMAKLVAVRLQRDIDELLASRKPLAIAGKRSRVVSAFYHLRPLESGSAPMMFLIHAVKRGIPNSPDRNKQKRRMREAIRQLSVYETVNQQLTASSQQVLILLRTAKIPSKSSSWETILADMELIGNKLKEATKDA